MYIRMGPLRGNNELHLDDIILHSRAEVDAYVVALQIVSGLLWPQQQQESNECPENPPSGTGVNS